MDSLFVLIPLRWLHIMAATMAVGVPIYLRLALMPAMQSLDDPSRTALREASAKRWRIVVYIAIVIFLATGFYNYLGVAQWRRLPEALQPRYHMVMGIKMLLAFGLFFVSSAVAGRSAKLVQFRTNASLWVAVMILLGMVIVALSNTLRYMHNSAVLA